MARKVILFTLFIALACLAAACGQGATPPPTSVAASDASVSIESTEPEEIVAAGQRIALIAQSNPIDVTYTWQLTGSGELAQTEGPAVQYIAPASVTVEETISINVTIADPNTNEESATDYLTIRLLPATSTPAAAATDTPASSTSGQPSTTATARVAAPRATAVVQPDSCPNFTSKRYERPSLPGSALIGAIVDPADCEIDLPAASPIEVSGTVGPLPADTFIWLFVNANGKYYPQCNETMPDGCPLDGPDWTARTFLGRAGCKENFTLALLAVDGEANEFLKATMSSWVNSGAYPGLDHDVMDDWGAEELTVAHVETAGVQCP